MELIRLTPLDLAIAAALILALAALSWQLHLGVGKRLLVSAARSLVQLTLLGLLLKLIFAQSDPWFIGAMLLLMSLIAAREIRARQARPFRGLWGYGIGGGTMFVSALALVLLATRVIIQVDPWFTPQYLIPLFGMLLGNTMSGIAIALDGLSRSAWRQRPVIEQRLLLGESWQQAIGDIRQEALRSGLIPIINQMSVAGLVTLPGMMTGQILAGSPPLEAAKYQILILLLVAAGVGFGTMGAIWIASRRLFDERQRLRLDRLRSR
ncbi:MAG TPA: iron export ABC transporter permease subunit FetB [Sedimenticola thiotaurini]|uniref:Iron export ABC transporter permease subunit FetB n=1 Tax=Sedimenticola thiotaurini TaxID=1543721 RepID=A0A831RME5_9GAMM|nr:iron export ABC transporter permease subunit FetB [Sedimenticola thiotaurini]